MVGSSWVKLFSTKQGEMCFAQRHNALSTVRLKLESPGLESSTLALSHCALVFFTLHVHLHTVWGTAVCTEQ